MRYLLLRVEVPPVSGGAGPRLQFLVSCSHNLVDVGVGTNDCYPKSSTHDLNVQVPALHGRQVGKNRSCVTSSTG
jgi:hypothetical protein